MPEPSTAASRASELRLLQRLELRILLAVIDICERHSLTYYISGGTYLGSVRHRGFIPWDDDVDMALPRPDYEKLMKILPNELPPSYELRTFETDSDCYRLWAKVRDRRVKVELPENKGRIIVPCWIDIFPLDGVPAPGLRREIWKNNLRFHELGWALSRINESPPTRVGRSRTKQLLIQIGNLVRVDRFLDARKWTQRRNRVIQSQPYAESEYCVNAVGRYTLRSIFHIKDVYGEGADYEFEGHTLRGPENYDAYLTQIYGNYRTPPDDDDRDWHQSRVVTKRKYSIGLVAGAFETAEDLRLIEEAHKYCDYLIAGVYSATLAPTTPTSETKRLETVATHRLVDEAVLISSTLHEEVLEQSPFQVVFVAEAELVDADPIQAEEILAEHEIEFVLLNPSSSEQALSTDPLK